jgi:adenosylcobinamide-phosphate synthase
MRLSLELQLLLAFGLDLLIGDPRWLPHPVKLIGWLAVRVEPLARQLVRFPYLAGAAAALVVVGVTGGLAFAAVHFAGRIDPLAGDIVSVLLLYTAIAARDLAGHSFRVYQALRSGDLPEARRRVGMIVGRDTDRLDEPGVTRAAVESVAESTLDGVTAPLFFGAVGGPVGALMYKATNTLDSMFGHKDERYLKFGWAAARLDDLANLIPARLTAPLVAMAAAPLGLRPFGALRICWRDGGKHESPNAGLAEAAFAGAMGVQLGGMNTYDGVPHPGPLIGDPLRPLEKKHIPWANALMLLTAALALLAFLGLRRLVVWGISA